MINKIGKYLASLALMFYAATAGLLTARGRQFHNLVCEYFGLQRHKPHLPQISVSGVCGNAGIELRELEVQAGNMSVDELAVICAIVKRERPGAIFEIGTMNGRTTLNMALNAPEHARIYTLDLPKTEVAQTKYPISKRYQKLVDKPQSGELFLKYSPEQLPAVGNIIQLYGDSGQFDFTPYRNSIDLVFIDGSHDYDYVLNDSEAALTLLREGKGVILWHDYRPGLEVVPALDAFLARRPGLEVFHIRNTGFAYLKR